MSSTTGVQNLLVNVFRPVYTYDPTTTLFTPKLELSNIDTYSGNTISIFRADIGDAGNNVYVGSNAGNPFTTLRACSNVTAVGYGAGSNISNVSNSTYIGYYAGNGAQTASNVVAIGANANGNGVSNVYVGSGTGGVGVGNSNVFLGAGTVGSGSGSILIGTGLTDASVSSVFKLGSTYLTGNISTKWLGVGSTSPIDSNSKFDVSGNVYVYGQQGINRSPERTLDLNGNFRAADAFGTLDFSNGSFTVTAAFKRTLGSTAITQPIIQYGKESGSGGSGSVTVTLPVAYSDTTYVAQATMQNTDPAEMAVSITSSNQFTIYWANGSGGSHQLAWTTFGT